MVLKKYFKITEGGNCTQSKKMFTGLIRHTVMITGISDTQRTTEA